MCRGIHDAIVNNMLLSGAPDLYTVGVRREPRIVLLTKHIFFQGKMR